MVLITIDGNIGAGKSSVLNYLHRNYKLPVDLEPVESWNKYLTDFYNDSTNVFKFQIRVWLDRCWIQEKTETTNIFVERSPRFIQDVFIDIAQEQNMITSSDKEILLSLHQKTNKLWENSIYIYLRSSPENCLKKIKKRNRVCENHISLEYITALHDKHEALYEKILKEDNNKIYCIDIDGSSVSDIANSILDIANKNTFEQKI